MAVMLASGIFVLVSVAGVPGRVIIARKT